MLFIVHYIGKKFIVCLLDKFFESFVVLFTEARADATANDSLQPFAVVGRREAPPCLSAFLLTLCSLIFMQIVKNMDLRTA